MSVKKRNSNEKMNAFSGTTSPEDAAKEIYGDNQATSLDTGVVRAKPTPIHQIWADLSQPRRAVPVSVRGRWTGDPDELPELLEHWRMMAEGESGKKIDVVKAIKGYQALEAEGEDSIYSRYAKLTALAASIYNEGLTNPITIVRNGDMYRVETGERRWLAHHLLAIHMDEKKFGKVLAREVDFNLFRQASENLARDGFNAIEMTRQIALLIMDARRNSDGTKYDSFDDLVLAGECDRRFYAQVANGNIHRIPEGLGDKIANATGLSLKRISHYRALLAPTEDDALNDQIWIDADANGWTEHFIRETYLPSLKPPKETSTAVEVPPANKGGITPNKTPSGTQILPTRFSQWTDKDAFGSGNPPAPSSFGQPKAPHVVGNDGEIGAPRDDSKVYGAIDMNLRGKKVRLADYRVGWIEEDRGQKLSFRKEGAASAIEIYRTAILSIIADGDVPATSPEINIKVGDRVRVIWDNDFRTGNRKTIDFTGEVCDIRDSSQGYPYGVKADNATEKYHYYYPPQALTLLPKETASDNRPSTKQEEETPKHAATDKVLSDGLTITIAQQFLLMAKMLGETDAETALHYVLGVSFGDVEKAAKELRKETVHQLLENQYQNLAALMTVFLGRLEDVLKDVAALDAAERQGE
jgi:hypothetical protein